MADQKPIIGLLGGGQLGRMLCEAATPSDIAEIAILDAADAPAKVFASRHHVTGSFKDAEKIKELARKVDVLTVEIEHVDVDVLDEISTKGVEVNGEDGKKTIKKVPVHPNPATLRLIKDKYLQKEELRKHGIAVAEQKDLTQGQGMFDAMHEVSRQFGYPWMLKARKESYDGRGNMKISNDDDINEAVKVFGSQACYAEKWVRFTKELAVMVVRVENDDDSLRGVRPFPVVETVHEDSICSRVYMPPRDTPADVIQRAEVLARRVGEVLKGRGVFAIEMFVDRDGEVMVNEIAPRPHNSGHLTIEAVPQMSQFAAHLQALLNEPLASTEPAFQSSIMINVLGGAEAGSHKRLLHVAKRFDDDDVRVHVHMYGKASKPGRKIGHITITGDMPVEKLEQTIQPLVKEAANMLEERHKAAAAPLRPVAASTLEGTKTKSQATVDTSQKSCKQPLVLVTMGSDSDLKVVKPGIDILRSFDVPYSLNITSAHRTPDEMTKVSNEAAAKGYKVVIAAAGGAAHLPGMFAASTTLPVIGLPVKATHLDGQDSLYSIVQMPRGVPVATVGINNSVNAALLAIKILGAHMPEYARKLEAYQEKNRTDVKEKAARLQEMGADEYLKAMKQ